MSLEQEHALGRKRAAARERVRQAQERAAPAWVDAHRCRWVVLRSKLKGRFENATIGG